MDDINPSDALYALTWAVNKAREAAKTDEIVRLTILPALIHKQEEAKREARR